MPMVYLMEFIGIIMGILMGSLNSEDKRRKQCRMFVGVNSVNPID